MKKIVFSVFCILMLLQSTPVFASPAGISKQEAANIATQQHPGRVLAVKKKANVYRVKIINDEGKVRIIAIDVNSGKIRHGNNQQP